MAQPSAVRDLTGGPGPGESNPSAAVDEPAGDVDKLRDQAAQIADSMVQLVHLFGSLKSRMIASADPDALPVFALVKLVREGPLRAKELAEHLCADPSTVSRQVAALVKAGLIERKADPDDGRASILVVTPSGRDRVAEHYVNRGHVIGPVISDWSDEERGTFLRLLTRYTERMTTHRDDLLTAMVSPSTVGASAAPRADAVAQFHPPTSRQPSRLQSSTERFN